MENIKITLETLYDILRNEQKKEDLQKLDVSFFFDVAGYLREKMALLEAKRGGENISAAGEKEKLEYELRSIRRILKGLYEKREKKVIDIALNRSKTGSDIIDTSAMLREEKEFYNLVLNSLDHYRRGVLLNLFRGELPSVDGQLQRAELALEQRKEQIKAELQRAQEEQNNQEQEYQEQDDQEPDRQKRGPPDPIKPNIEPNHPLARIKFIHPTPSFVWKDLKVYGPFDHGEETEIFPEVAELLVRKGRAEKI